MTFPAYGATTAGCRALGDVADVLAERDAFVASRRQSHGPSREAVEVAVRMAEVLAEQ